ncbi:hypothetical protein ACWDOP_38710 [Nocardia sp. NPDC003693]
MLPAPSKYDELGLKVQRAQFELENIRGIGVVEGVKVVVDSENRLVSINIRGEELILAAYRAAVAHKEPQVAEAMRDVLADPQVASVRTFAEANSARLEEQRRRREEQAEDDGPVRLFERNVY